MPRHVIDNHGNTRHLGWRPSPKRFGDPHMGDGFGMTPAQKGFNVDPLVSLRSIFFQVLDQGSIGSCTGHGWAYAYRGVRRKLGLPDMMPSRLGIYEGERERDGVPLYEDSGAYIHDGAQVLAQRGAFPEAMWPYDVSKYSVAAPAACWTEAANHKALRWYTLSTVEWIQACLTLGYPVVIGFAVYESFMSEEVSSTGNVPMPQPGEKCLGGHCIALFGADANWIVDTSVIGAFDFPNSWGEGWGNQGWGKLPFEFIRQALATDACAVHDEL
jgi:C1A family cysteine protease